MLAPLLASVSALAAAPMYTVIDVGGGTATAVNGSGAVAGWFTDPFGIYHAFVHDGSSRAEFGWNAQAFALGESGIAYGIVFDGGGNSIATQWTNGSPSPVGPAGSAALGVNASGAVVGAASGSAVIYSGGPAVAAGPAGSSWSAGYAINDAGAVAGTALRPGGFGAFVHVPGLGPLWLASLGGAASYGAAINEWNVVAGTAQTRSGYLHAAMWIDGSVHDLGTLGGTNSGAYGISGSGDVVGYSLVADGDSAAFLYSGGVLWDLNALAGGNGWVLEAAYGINERGQIVGTGLYQGVRRAFRLDPVAVAGVTSPGAAEVPEPSTALLLLLPLLVWPVRRLLY